MTTVINTVHPSKTYSTYENAVKAAEKKYGHTDLRYAILATPDGRFYPAFLGEVAIKHGVHFNFAVIG